MVCKCKKRICSRCSHCIGCSCSCTTVLQRRRGRPASSVPRKRMRTFVDYAESSDDETAKDTNDRIELKYVLQTLGLPNLSHNLPNSRKSVAVHNATSSDLQRCNKVLRQICAAVCNLIYPADGPGYFRTRCDASSKSKVMLDGDCLTSLLHAYGATTRCSQERRVIRGILYAHVPLKQLNDLLLKHGIFKDIDNELNDDELEEPSGLRQESVAGNEFGENYIGSEAIQGTERESAEHVERETTDVVSATVGAKSYIGRKAYISGRLDWDRVLIHGRRNAQTLSWGTKTVKVDQEKFVLPAVTRKMRRALMFQNYGTACQEEGVKSFGKSTFFEIAGSLTARDSKRKSAVDYVVGTLVNGTVKDLRRMITVFASPSQCQKLYDMVENVEYFLKGVFIESHVGRDTEGFHDKQFALQAARVPASSKKSVSCSGCLTPFAMLKKIEQLVPPDRPDALQAIKDYTYNFQEYLAHAQRVRAQQDAIQKIVSDIVEDKIHDRAILLVDYKMKFEPVRFREKTVEFFGKRGTSWHGMVVFYLAELYDEAHQYNGPGHLSMMYYDHIAQGGSKQDFIAVGSIIEAGLIRLRKDFPSVREVILLSDNAGCYQNSILPIMAPFIAKTNGLSLLKFLHTETQDGKSLVDAHFAISMKHVNRSVAEGHDVTTPSALLVALRSNGGVRNSAAELVRVNRDNINLLRWVSLYVSENGGLAWIGRINEYNYERWSESQQKVLITCFRYSGVEDGRQCVFSRNGASRTLKHTVYQTKIHPVAEELHSAEQEIVGLETGVTILRQQSIEKFFVRRSRKNADMLQSRFLTSIIDEDESLNEDSQTSDNDGIVCDNCKWPFTSENRLLQHMQYCFEKKGTKTRLSKHGPFDCVMVYCSLRT